MEAVQELRAKDPGRIFFPQDAEKYHVYTKEYPEGFVDILNELEYLDFPEEDGIPLESNWHRIQMNLFIDSVYARWRDRDDYFAGGNMFIHYSVQQLKNRDFLGPDFFVVKNTDGKRKRNTWKVWEENGRFPDVIVELASTSTIRNDLGKKKDLYERIFRTPEYFCYDPETHHLRGWRLRGRRYEEIVPNEQGWMKSEELGLWLGRWEGEFLLLNTIWLRFYDDTGGLVPTIAETEARRAEAEARRAETEALRAEAEALRAETEARRAEAAEAELMRLRAFLAQHGIRVPETEKD